MTLQGQDIVCIGTSDWKTEAPINQHQLMLRLGATNRVLFVESLGLRRPQIAGRDLKRIGRRLLTGLRGVRDEGSVHVLSPLVLPFHGSEAVRKLNRLLLRRQVTHAMRRLGFGKPVLWGYAPQAGELIEPLDPNLTIYHCVDDIAAQKGIDGEGFRAAEEAFARRADLVIASSPSLAERMKGFNSQVLYAPNVADTILFSQALAAGPVDPAIAALPRPLLVFQGAIVGTKLDLGLLEEVARLRPQWTIALVGPQGLGDPGVDLSILSDMLNIHLLGPRGQSQLPAVLRGADAGLIPYAINELTRSIFPMKIYEYMAAGLPVIATELPALAGVEGIERVADAGAMVAAVEREMAVDTPERRRQRSRLAGGHSWESRIAEIEAALDGLSGGIGGRQSRP